ncbi:MAG TPA: phosphatidate cytidylyltransferase [Chitinophagaceae bacterium]
MPLNWQTFKTRAVSAIVFVIVMLVGLLWNQWTFFLLFSVIHMGCWVEYQRLVAKIDPAYASISSLHRYGVILTGWGFMWWMNQQQIDGFHVSTAGFWIMVAGAIAVNIDTLVNRRGKLIAHSLLGLLYISLSFGLLVSLANTDAFSAFNAGSVIENEFNGSVGVLAFLVVLTMWVNDTMAYIVGSLIGRTQLSPISPKKTWEGTIGGIILAVVAIGLLYSSGFPAWISGSDITGSGYNVNNPHWYVAAGIAAVMGTFGDLFESKLKRLAGVKDSGQMMPGHGGFLDRFDSLLLATPFVWLYVWLVNG